MTGGRGRASPDAINERWLRDHLPPRAELAHKGDFGRVLIVAGSLDYPGAAVLAGLGALRSGAGLVRVATARAVAERMAPSVPELTWMPLDEEAPGLVAPGGWRRVAAEAASFDAVVVGPGLGSLATTLRRARTLILALRVPSVIDADGLNALAEDPRWSRDAGGPLILTPHAGEFARLTRSTAPAGGDDAARLAQAGELASGSRQVVVLKGARTVVADPDGSALVSTVATPALATGGTGDVLAGAIGAFLAAGAAPFIAAGLGVGLHAAAGLLAASRVGSAGALATDVARLLPEVRRRLEGGAPG